MHALDITRAAKSLIAVSIDDASLRIGGLSDAVLQLAAKKEMQRQTPRMTLVSRIKAELRRRQRSLVRAPKEVA